MSEQINKNNIHCFLVDYIQADDYYILYRERNTSKTAVCVCVCVCVEKSYLYLQIVSAIPIF